MKAQNALTLLACLQTLATFQGTIPGQAQEKINEAGKLLTTDTQVAISLLRQAVRSYEKLSQPYQTAYDVLLQRYEEQKKAKTLIEDDDENDATLNYFLENQLPPTLPKLGEILTQLNPAEALKQELSTATNKPPEERSSDENTLVEFFMGVPLF
ncbi:hypothetical protein Q5692_18250 [Microcoleus sp. C2C3]|uniref:hypothetical protein n=1 Tax=unclassified Microcoleus TaxID=2642155 RepID=UPI002FD1B536